MSPDRKSTRLNSSHRDIRSCPTRRSSDLLFVQPQFIIIQIGARKQLILIEQKIGNVTVAKHVSRSEEHTSELQSPRYTLLPYTTLFRSPVRTTAVHHHPDWRAQTTYPYRAENRQRNRC